MTPHVKSAEVQGQGTWIDHKNRHRLAVWLSYLFNPLVLPVALFALILRHFEAPPSVLVAVSLISLVFWCLLPFGYLLWLLRLRRIDSIEVWQRTRRTRPLLVGLASYLVGFVTLISFDYAAQPLIVAVAATILINTGLITVINLRTKISLHVSGVAGFVSVLIFVAGTPWPSLLTDQAPLFLRPASISPLLLLVPLMMWARVRIGAHNWNQVLGGALFGLILPFSELYLLLQTGLLNSF